MATDVKQAPKATRHWAEYVFCLLVGSMYIYSLNRVIISATFIRVTQLRLFTMGAVALVLFVLIFYNRITRIVSAAVVTLSAFILFFTFERWERQMQHLYDVTRMVRGYLLYSPELGATLLWAISLLLGLVVAVFMLYRFSFYLLAITGVAIFLFTWGPGFTRDIVSFLIFLVCFCLILIRKTNRGLSAVYVAAPICIALVWFVHASVPTEADLFQRRTLQELFDGPLAAIGDFIYIMTNPMYFSFQSTGFSGQGGRLGGPVTPNNRNVMTVMAPGRTYLAGATHNTYTGYSWITTLEPGQLYTQGMNPSQFEMLETTVSLIRNATHISDNSFMPASALWGIFPTEDHRHLSTGQFPALGIGGTAADTISRVIFPLRIFPRSGDQAAMISAVGTQSAFLPAEGVLLAGSPDVHYLHAYLPMEQVTIAIGTNRTGTVFRPPNTRSLWFHPAGTDYLPSLMYDPTGDMRAPGFMARGTQYTLSFLNVDHRLSFISNMLSQSFEGFHATMEEHVFLIPFDYMPQEFYEFYHEHDIEDYACNSTYVTIIYYNVTDDAYPGRMYAIRYPREVLGIPQHDIDVTAQDINDLFEMFAYQGPNRELQYLPSFSLLSAKLDSFSYGVLARYAETVREHFMYVPETVPQRVHDLVFEITYGLETDYERVMAIRDYLIQFPYSLTPQPVPAGVCFVDHFLFVGQEGYCSYYASAMAVMSRIAGVPSRYVEGFLLPPAPPEADDDIAIFVVTNMMAHAWVEVYMEGFGWLVVEATAPYAFFLDQTLTLPRGEFQAGWFDEDWWSYMEDYYHLFASGMSPFTPGSGSTEFGPGDMTDPLGGGTLTMERLRVIVLVAFVAVSIAVLAFLLGQYIKVATVTRRVNRLPINQRITTYFSGIIAIASHVTSAKDPAETPYSYGQRVGMRFAFKNDSARLRDLVALYYRARYGSRQLSDEECDVMMESYFDMVNYMRVEHKTSHFLYLRYILRIGAI